MRSKIRSLISIIRLAGLAVAALAMWGFSTIAEEVLEKESYAFDTSILLYLRSLHTPLRDRIMLGFTFLGEPKLLLVICLTLGIVLLARNHRSEAATIAIAGGGAMGLNLLLKKLFARARPQLWERVVNVTFYSFPSGHAMISMVIYGLLGYFLGARFPKQRWSIYSLTVVLIAAIGLSRLYLGVHWPTDVIAGYTAGVVWLIACILSLEIWKELRSLTTASKEEFLSPDNSQE
ncbi:phosphoesterase PA-phosphatase related protein [Oscillatoria nigro-viridis PCC 7112]|uniref:Phosphoesterase PA-phosphatase related protein n=1 Tax=Phormidium nigroviride PCC 7112 TaxID=179408 RepID=K9VPA2_9CYAN|nr:phosphatase PAP2 family protein [Oscillatoria nigro-viridis]AFZ09928.1 phosphoesterase PA-phosphatase related protein [Oscillatoria nigro-viridis PCC 7112]